MNKLKSFLLSPFEDEPPLDDPVEPIVDDPSTETETEKPQPAPITREDLDNAISSLRPEPTPDPAPAPLTQEQLDEQLERYRPDQQLITTLLNSEVPDEQKLAALEQMTQGIYKYSTNTANQLAQHYVAELRKEIQPQLSAAQQMQVQTWENEFYGENPELKGHKELVQAATNHLKTQGVQPKSKAEAFKNVAETAIAIGQRLNPEFGKKKSSRMATVSTGGQGGNQSSQPAASKRGAADIW